MIFQIIRLPFTVFGGIHTIVSRTVSFAVVFSVIVWASVLLYGIFYSIYVPKSQHICPVHFYVEPRICHKGTCHFPVSKVALRRPGVGEHLMPGQRYKIFLELEMPESEANQRIGMFTVKLDMLSKEGKVVRTSLRSGSLRYKSFVVRLFYTLLYIPIFLLGSAEEKQVVSIGLFESYEEAYMLPSTHAEVEIRNEFIEIYTATLKIYADFSGLRYILYYWPLTSALIGISTNICFICMVSLFSWIQFAPPKQTQSKPPPSEADIEEEKEEPSDSEEKSADPDEDQSDAVEETASTSTTTVRQRRRDLEQRDCTVLSQVVDEAELSAR